jgi:hypothetical protein
MFAAKRKFGYHADGNSANTRRKHMKKYQKMFAKIVKEHGGNSAYARILKVNESNVRRWASGKIKLPGWVIVHILSTK